MPTPAIPLSGFVAQVIREEFARVLNQLFVTSVQMRGSSDLAVRLRIVLRHAVPPGITLSGWALSALFSSAAVIKTVFARPAIGGLFVMATSARDIPGSVLVAGAVIALYLAMAAAPALLQTHAPFRTDLAASLRPPSLDHLFGTDRSGRDLFSRVVEDTRASLEIGIGATSLSLALALLLGVTAGLAGGAVDRAIGRFLEVMLAFPNLFPALLLITVFEATPATLIAAVGIGTAPGCARMVRGQFLAVKGAGYVEAARALGHSRLRILRRHILPNAMRPLVALVTLGVGQSIVWASILAFLGLGVAAPSPEWGAARFRPQLRDARVVARGDARPRDHRVRAVGHRGPPPHSGPPQRARARVRCWTRAVTGQAACPALSL
jgi:peptide/nickel transport system permease protein